VQPQAQPASLEAGMANQHDTPAAPKVTAWVLWTVHGFCQLLAMIAERKRQPLS
jgi:hypothetical protein